MVQKVQTWVWITNETTLETIEAIGTSSFKIREWRQTTARYVNKCEWNGKVTWYWQTWDERQSEEVISTDTAIDSQNWNQEFIIDSGWIRVPVAWTYQITFTWSWWSSTSNATFILKWWDKELYSNEHTSSQTETVTVVANLWKFDLIELRWSFYYTGSSSSATMNIQVSSIIIQQL